MPLASLVLLAPPPPVVPSPPPSEEILKTFADQMRDGAIPEPRKYYRYGETLTPDVWFDAKAVWEVKAPAYVREPVGQWGHTCSNCVETHAQIVMARALECDDGGGVGADSSLRTALRQPWCGALLLLLPPPRRQLPDLLAALRQPPPPLQGSQQSRP